MNKGEETAFPNPEFIQGGDGLTKRELFAAMAMQGILSDESNLNWADTIAERNSETTYQVAARNAVRFADALLDQLSKSE